jgi:hypothetical protein
VTYDRLVVSSINKINRHDITEILLKVALNTIKQTNKHINVYIPVTITHVKDYKIGICYVPAKHAALRSKSKDCLARNQDNISECDDMSIRCCFSELTL